MDKINEKVLSYYFIKEYQWKDDWFSTDGICKAKINASNEFLQTNKYVDYSIFGDCFSQLKKMKTVESSTQVLEEIRLNLMQGKGYHLGGEVSGIDIGTKLTRAIDNLGSKDGIEAPISWNISTPIENQSVPTSEIIEIIEAWIKFLIEQENIKLNRVKKAHNT